MRTEQEIFEELAALCATPGYAHALASLCFRDNIVGYRDELRGEDYAKLFTFDRLIRTEISTLLGLMARVPLDLKLPTPGEIGSIIHRSEALLKELHEAILAPFEEVFIKAIADPEHPNPFLTPGAMREPIFYGAESAYSFQYRDFAPQKYARDADWLRRNKGFTIADAQAVVKAILTFFHSHFVEFVRGLRDVPRERWTVLDGFAFQLADILLGSGLPRDVVINVLDAFALPEEGNPTFTSLHEFNATNAFPLLKTTDGRYLLFQYVSLTEALYDTPYYWLFADKSYRDEASKHRGLFTEEFAAERLRAVFGAENVFCNVDIWESKGKKIGEIDVLVLFAGHALVVQAKSKKLTLVARKGNDLQLRDDFKAAVQDACDQAVVCGEELLAGMARFADALGNNIAIPKGIKVVHPICIVSEHYPALAFQAHQFLQQPAGSKVKSALVGDVFFLDTVTEMLETPLRLLSYLDLRAMAGKNLLLSHENTALAFHLAQNLWMDDYDQMQLADDLTEDLDIAMAVRRDGVDGRRTPKGILTALNGTAVGRILEEVTASPGSIATGVGLHLLKLSGKTARELSQIIVTLAEKSAREGRLLDTTLGIAKGQTGITVHCTGADRLPAAMDLRRHCELRKHSSRAETWCGIAVEPGTGNYRFGILLEDPWQPNAVLDEQLKSMSSGVPPSAFKKYARSGVVALPKIARNAPCTCGSGQKFKRCCGRPSPR